MPSGEGASRSVQTKRWRIHYSEVGAGHPVILLHGSGPGATGRSNFSQNLAYLGARYRVLAMDFPGWGASDPVKAIDERDNVLALKLFMDALGIEKAALIGNSMGGQAALGLAVEHPARVSHVITMGASAQGTNVFSPAGLTEGIRILVDAYRTPDVEHFERLVRVMVYDATFATRQILEERVAAARRWPIHIKNWLEPVERGMAVNIGYSPANVIGRLSNVAVPALIMHGRDDRTVPMENGLRIFSAIPSATLTVFNRCGHWAQVEHGDHFNWLVDQFLTHNGVPLSG